MAGTKSTKADKTDKEQNPNIPSAAAQMAGTVSDEALVSARTPGAGNAAAGVGSLPAAQAARDGASPVGEAEADQTP